MEKYQQIGCSSRDKLLKEEILGHQQTKTIQEAQRAGTKYKPQVKTSLNLATGRCKLNVLSTLRAYHKLAYDIAEGIQSNKTAQHQGRSYNTLEAIAMKHGLEREINLWSYLRQIKTGKEIKRANKTNKTKKSKK